MGKEIRRRSDSEFMFKSKEDFGLLVFSFFVPFEGECVLGFVIP